MSSSEEFSDSSTEGYLSDDSECLDFQEIETDERVNQELLSESSTADKETWIVGQTQTPNSSSLRARFRFELKGLVKCLKCTENMEKGFPGVQCFRV